jgi:hypothetical protein
MESLSRSSWNHCPDPRGIDVQLGVEYAKLSLEMKGAVAKLKEAA